MSIKFEILKLKHGENYIVPESDYGKADIWLINETYILFRIPWLGGTPQFVKAYSFIHIDDLIKEISEWT